MPTDPHPDFFARHADLLHQALEGTTDRGYWTPYPENPTDSAYEAGAAERGEAGFRDLLGRHFALDGHPTTGTTNPRGVCAAKPSATADGSTISSPSMRPFSSG